MKTTGIIRKIDNVGRIVIPTEVRKVLQIKTNDSLEIILDAKNESVTFKKYYPKQYQNSIDRIIESIEDGDSESKEEAVQLLQQVKSLLVEK